MAAVAALVLVVVLTSGEEEPSGPGTRTPRPRVRIPRQRPPRQQPITNLDEAIAALKESDHRRQTAGLTFIARTPVNAAKQAEVASAINPMFNSSHPSVRNEAVIAAADWGTRVNIPGILDSLHPQGHGQSGAKETSAMKALVRLKPPKAAKAIVPYLQNNALARAAEDDLEKLGPMAEDALLGWMNQPHHDKNVRERARRLLAKLPNIQPKMLDQSIKDLKDKNTQRQHHAMEWISTQDVVPAKQREVVEALKAKTKTGKMGGYSEQRVRAIAKWGGKDDLQFFFDVVNDRSTGFFIPQAVAAAKDFIVNNVTPEYVRRFADQLGDFFKSRGAIAMLKLFPPKVAEPELIKYLNHANGRARQHARTILNDYKTKPESYAKQVLEDLKSEEQPVRISAAQFAATLEPIPELREQMVQVLGDILGKGDPNEHAHVAKALATWATSRDVPQLVILVRDVSKRVDRDSKRKGIELLAESMDERAVLPVATALLDRYQRNAASAALKKIGPKAEAVVATFLENRDRNLQIEACAILAVIGTRESLPALNTYLRKARFSTEKSAAMVAIRTITARAKAAPKK